MDTELTSLCSLAALALVGVAACNEPANRGTEGDASAGSDAAPGADTSADVAGDTPIRDVAADAEAEVIDRVDVGLPDVPMADSGPRDSGPADVSGDAADTRPPSDTSPPPDLAAACAASCTARDPAMGACPVAADVTCEEWCLDAGSGTDAPVADALMRCIETDPLCFQTPLQCVLGVLYPEPFPHTVTLIGTGFDVPDGTIVVAGVDQAADELVLTRGVVTAGAFELRIDVTMPALASHLTMFYLDVAEPGSCTPGRDVTGTASVELWALDHADLTLPDWVLRVSPDPDRDARFVCDYL